MPASKVESYEISSYDSLINMARDMGDNKAVKLLQQNLKEEQQTLKKMQGFAKKIKPGTDGDGRRREGRDGAEFVAGQEDPPGRMSGLS